MIVKFQIFLLEHLIFNQIAKDRGLLHRLCQLFSDSLLVWGFFPVVIIKSNS